MSFQSGIHAKMAIFDRKSHAPETSEGSESGSILLVRLFFICQATFLSFDILSVAWAERGFGGGLVSTKMKLEFHQQDLTQDPATRSKTKHDTFLVTQFVSL